MNKKLFVTTKINLLYISLLTLYSYLEKDTFKQIYLNNKINSYSENTIFLDYFKYHKYSYIKQIKFILIIYKISQNQAIQHLAHYIINNYYNNYPINISYFDKFKYLYYKKYDYYKHNKLKINIHNIAIINLYIIIVCYKKSIFLILKYLYDPI